MTPERRRDEVEESQAPTAPESNESTGAMYRLTGNRRPEARHARRVRKSALAQSDYGRILFYSNKFELPTDDSRHRRMVTGRLLAVGRR
jgi:hypothetical protein